MDAANVRSSAAFDALALAGDGLVEANETWFRRRSLCAFERDHRTCLVEAYRDRTLILQAALAGGSDTRRLRCRGEWGKRALQLMVADNGAVLLTDAGQIFAVATPRHTHATWQPAVSYTRQGNRFVFQLRGKATTICNADS